MNCSSKARVVQDANIFDRQRGVGGIVRWRGSQNRKPMRRAKHNSLGKLNSRAVSRMRPLHALRAIASFANALNGGSLLKSSSGPWLFAQSGLRVRRRSLDFEGALIRNGAVDVARIPAVTDRRIELVEHERAPARILH
jgi:hypothetical protein